MAISIKQGFANAFTNAKVLCGVLLAISLSPFALAERVKNQPVIEKTIVTDSAVAKPTRKRRLSSVSENPVKELTQKVEALEKQVEHLDAEMDVMREQHRFMVHRTSVGFLDQTYLKAGIALVLPRSRSFSFRTDTGIGAFVGLGQYFGRNHVADLSLDWDIYPSLTLRYRYEFHPDSPNISWGPVVGFKVRMAEIKPFDNFLDRPQDLKSGYAMLGMILGFPMGRSLVSTEFVYLFNQQNFFFINVGIHFFI